MIRWLGWCLCALSIAACSRGGTQVVLPALDRSAEIQLFCADLEQVTITYQPGAKKAWISSAVTNQVVRVGVAIDGDPTQSSLFDAGSLLVTGLDRGDVMRDILFDPRPGSDLAYMVSLPGVPRPGAQRCGGRAAQCR